MNANLSFCQEIRSPLSIYLLTSRLVALISSKAAAGKATAGQLKAGLLHTLAKTYTFAAGQFEAKLEPTWSQPWANLGQLEAKLGQLRPT